MTSRGRVTIDEFACKCGCGRHIEKVSPGFLRKLNEARALTSSKFVITSGYRCPTYNLSIGGVEGSAHTKGLAADIAADDSTTLYEVLTTLIKVGFKRFGIGEGFVHVDCDITKPYGKVWTYYKELRKELANDKHN